MIETKIIDAGIDWMTLTTKEPTRYAEWEQAFEFVAAEEKKRGHKWTDARVLGYVGQACGHAFIGKRHDGAMLRLTSAAAQIYGHLFSPDACHCTRIDLQVTVEMFTPRAAFLNQAYTHAVAQRPANGRPPTYTILNNSLGGSTLYVGSRSSMRYGRIYDKGEESGTEVPGRTFRWELEIKDQLADQAVLMLNNSSSPERTLLSIVGSFFSERSLPVTWNIPPLEDRFVLPRIPLEDANSLKWLAGPVATTVERLMRSVGPEQTIRALFHKALTSSTDDDTLSAFVEAWPD